MPIAAFFTNARYITHGTKRTALCRVTNKWPHSGLVGFQAIFFNPFSVSKRVNLAEIVSK